MTFSINALTIEQATYELNNMSEKFKACSKDAEITTKSGRVYKVTNILSNDISQMAMNASSFKTIECKLCQVFPQYYLEDLCLQIIRGPKKLKVTRGLIHLCNSHPKEIPQDIVDKITSIFLD